MSTILEAIRYRVQATVRSASAIAMLRKRSSKVAVAFWIILLLTGLYTLAATA